MDSEIEVPPVYVNVFYSTPRGAHHMRSMALSLVAAFLARQKREVTVRRDGVSWISRDIIGEVFWCDRDHPGVHRPHWCWWLDDGAGTSARRATREAVNG